VCRQVLFPDIQDERLILTCAAHDQLVRQRATDTVFAHVRRDGDGDFRQGNAVRADRKRGSLQDVHTAPTLTPAASAATTAMSPLPGRRLRTSSESASGSGQSSMTRAGRCRGCVSAACVTQPLTWGRAHRPRELTDVGKRRESGGRFLRWNMLRRDLLSGHAMGGRQNEQKTSCLCENRLCHNSFLSAG
jgi:hypothetical protein